MHRTREFLLALAVWCLGCCAYLGSLEWPWFTPGAGRQVHPSLTQITGLDAYAFLFERLGGGCFVWLAHPALYVGWLLLLCRRWRGASVAGCLALMFAVNAPLVFQPRAGPWLPPGAGYYAWFVSMALLACSVLVRNRFFRSDTIINDESVRRLTAQQRATDAELAELKQQVTALFDHQAVAFLDAVDNAHPGKRGDA